MTNVLQINVNDFDYSLPEERIAKYPLNLRDSSKLIIMNGKSISENVFNKIGDYLPQNSLIVFNNSKVIKARLLFFKETGSQIEIFCLEPMNPADYSHSLLSKKSCSWKCLVGNNKKWKSGKISKTIQIKENATTISATRINNLGNAYEILFVWDNTNISFSEILQEFGKTPIPPYLNRQSEDIDITRYQTVYGTNEGSVAAPTAGFHFTDEVFSLLSQKNIHSDYITLHVGAGTFQPIKTDNIFSHEMHTEHFFVTKENIRNIIKHYGNITVVGTTTVRTLESLFVIACKIFLYENKKKNPFFVEQWETYKDEYIRLRNNAVDVMSNLLQWMDINNLEHLECSTQTMIIPGYKFVFTNRLITNFHQPKSTLLLLLAAFTGEKWKDAYNYALRNNFRFLSYGDSCLFLE
ncbi:MAG TPA: S-adenosylmethionine:tRNA ribosyltransferase-isomerase [Bacteroidales bacterium]|nr:S-adenosylmethionine:tRNA ribosyltransferase-isomerase [Bacteroidales bacterium]